MAGRCALNAGIVVRVHGREPELWSIGRMADRLSAGTGSTPVSSAMSLREIRPAARTLVSKSRYEGSSPTSSAKSEHGIAAGASGLQPDDASSTLAARSMRKSSSGQDATLPTSRARVRVPPSAPSYEVAYPRQQGICLQSRSSGVQFSPPPPDCVEKKRVHPESEGLDCQEV